MIDQPHPRHELPSGRTFVVAGEFGVDDFPESIPPLDLCASTATLRSEVFLAGDLVDFFF